MVACFLINLSANARDVPKVKSDSVTDIADVCVMPWSCLNQSMHRDSILFEMV